MSRAQINAEVQAAARREAFIEAVAEKMLDDDWQHGWGVSNRPGDEENLRSWLRTVWLEARGEEWGETKP